MFSESENVLVSPCGLHWGGGGFLETSGRGMEEKKKSLLVKYDQIY